MAQLGTFAGGDVDINTSERLVTITGGVVEIDGVLDPPTGFSDWGGWRIVCDSYGRPSGSGATTFTPTAYTDSERSITLSSTNYNLTDTGKRFTFTNLGGYAGSYGSPSTSVNTTTKFYIRKIGDNKIKFYANETNALNDSDPIRFSTNGTISTMRIQYDNARGGFRSTTGASGTLGGGKQSLVIIEKRNGYRFGGDNFESGADSDGANARFAGDGTNTMVYSNISWVVEPGGRSDFDVAVGSNVNGSQGPKVVITGVSLTQLSESGNDANFNHYSGQCTIRSHSEVGFGLRIANYTTGHAFEFTTPIQDGAEVDGLVIDNITNATHHADSSNARVAVRLARVVLNGTFVISKLNTPNITDVDGGSNSGSKTLVLVDPVGLPTITSNWGRHVNIEVRRNIPFTFTGMIVPSGTRMYAQNQITGGEGTNGLVSGTSDTIEVQTQRTLNNTSTTWTNYNQYKFRMTSLAFRKYALETTQTIGNIPATITADLTPDNFPDGAAISSITYPSGNNLPDTLSEIIRLIKQYEVDNPFHDDYPAGPLIYIDGTAVKLNDDYRLTLGSTNDTPGFNIGESNGHDLVGIKTSTTISASNGLNTLEASGAGETINTTSVDAGDGVFFKDSTGQGSIVRITNNMGSSVLFSVVDTADGDIEGSATIANGAVGDVVISTKGLSSTYNVVGKRVGYDYFSSDVDLSDGGLVSVTAPAQRQIVQPSGTASYVTTVSVPNTLTTDFSHSGNTPAARLECGDATFSARQLFKSYEDEMATADGAAYMGLGGAQMTYIDSALKGNEVVLGAHTKVKRKSTTDTNATIRATLYAPDDAPIDDVNGDVQTIEGLDIPAVAQAIITTTDFDPSEAGVQSVWGKLDAIESGGGGGGGGGFTSDDRTKLEAIKTTTDALDVPTESEIATAVSGALTIPTSAQNATAVWGATDKTITGGGFTATDRTALTNMKSTIDDLDVPTTDQITESVWAEIIDGGITTDLTITPEAEAGDGFRIPADDAVLIANGDSFVFTSTGGYSNISTTETYYAYVSNNVLYVYGSAHNALTPGSQWIQPSGGTIGDVRIVFVGKKPIGTAGVALHRILAAVAEIDSVQEEHADTTIAVGALLTQLLGDDFVEGGYSLQDALQIILAIIAGKASRSGERTTFHRLDADETAVIRADSNADGRTAPTRNPT